MQNCGCASLILLVILTLGRPDCQGADSDPFLRLLGGGGAIERRPDFAADALGCGADGLVAEVRVALRRRGVCVPEQLAHEREREPGADGGCRVGVAEVVQAHVREPCKASDAVPWALEAVEASTVALARADVGVARDAWRLAQEGERGGGKRDALGAGLAVGEHEFGALEVYGAPGEL